MDWEPRRIEQALRHMAERTRFCVSGELRSLALIAMWDYLDRKRLPTSPVYTLDVWSEAGGLQEHMMTTNDGGVAVAAYEALVVKRPAAIVKLRSGIGLVRSTVRDPERREIEG